MVCRLLARKKGQQPLTTKELAKRSGLERKTIVRLAKLESWSRLLRVVDAYREACGVRPATERKCVEYVKLQRGAKNPFPHLSKLPWQERKMLARILKQQ